MNRSLLEAATGDSSQSRFPQTVVTVSREEFIEPIALKVRDAQGNEATLPEDLTGHLFLIGPVGSVNSPTVTDSSDVVWASKDGWTALYNGDGMVYRLSFDRDNASLKTRLMKPPCYFADKAVSNSNNGDRYQGLEFSNLGISRGSFNVLGMRNQLNTAFLPFKLADESSDRLLVTKPFGLKSRIQESKVKSNLRPKLDMQPCLSRQ